MTLPFVSAILPVLLLLYFIYKKDKYQPEPVGKLLLTFFVGCFSVVPAATIEALLAMFTPGIPVVDQVYTGFVVAGLTEEACKLALLMLVVWRSRHFDEYFDGIVYAVFLSLGFACVENIGYVLSNDDPMMVALFRGLLAVPAHFLFAVVMGYHLALAKFDQPHRRSHLWHALLYPALLHGTYDALLMVSDALSSGAEDEVTAGVMVSSVLIIVFLVFDVMLWRRGLKRIKRMQERSKEQSFDPQNPFEGFTWIV